MTIFRSRLFIASFIALFISINISYAIVPLLLALETTASRAAIFSFLANGVATVASNDDITVKSSTNRKLTIKRGLNAALGFATIAQLLGYQSSPNSSTSCGNWLFSQNGSTSSDRASLQAMGDAFAASFSFVGSGWFLDSALTSANGGLDVWSNYYTPTLNNGGPFTISCSCLFTVTSPPLTSSDNLISDLRNNPSQLLTDNLVSAASNLSSTNPSQFDSTVIVEDTANYQLPSDYSSGDSLAVDNLGSLTLNGVPLNGNVGTFTGQDGLTHHMTIGANGDLLVDGQPSTGFTASNLSTGSSTTTSSNGTTSTTTSTVDNSGIIAAERAVVDSVNRASAANTSALNSLETAVNNSALDYGVVPPDAPMITNKTYDFSTFGLAPLSLTNASGVCPAAPSFVLKGQTVSIDNTPICTFFDWVRPAILSLGWFGAIMVFVGTVRNN